MSERSTEIYWTIVQECLVQFHGFSPAEALHACQKLRGRLATPPPGITSGMIYHLEPFHLANQLAQAESRNLANDYEKYAAIIETAEAGLPADSEFAGEGAEEEPVRETLAGTFESKESQGMATSTTPHEAPDQSHGADDELITRTQAGDAAASDELVVKYRPRLYGLTQDIWSKASAGPLGVIYLPRLWLKFSLEAAGKLAPGGPGSGKGYEAMTLGALGITEEAAKAFIASSKPTYPQFEAWVKKQPGVKLDKASIYKHNVAIMGYIHDDEARKGTLSASDLPADGPVNPGMVEYNLDDWFEFRQAVLK